MNCFLDFILDFNVMLIISIKEVRTKKCNYISGTIFN